MRFRKALCVLLCFGFAALAFAAEPAKSSPLGVRQQRVKRMMQTLDRKFQDLAQKLQEKEPEQAELLIKAFQQSQERLIEGRMSDISKLLDSANLSEADSKQNEVLLELDDLLRVLLDPVQRLGQGKQGDRSPRADARVCPRPTQETARSPARHRSTRQ